MYCGTNKTALSSQRQLSDAMLRLLEEKTFSAISISELCREAAVSRQTFYSLFSSKESVVTYTLLEHCCYTPEGEGGTLRQMSRGYSRYLQSHADILRTLVENDITYLLYDGFYDSLLGCDCFLRGQTEEVRTYAADFVAGGFTSIARSFVRSGANTDPALLDELVWSLFSGSFFED